MITGVGLFVGILAGVVVQLTAQLILMNIQRRNAVRVFKTEVEFNAHAMAEFRQRFDRLLNRVSSGQATEVDLYFSMSDFDYSAVAPLNNSGYFHTLLQSDGARHYFSVMRFFNNPNAEWLTHKVQADHRERRLLDFLEWLEGKIEEGQKSLKAVQEKLK